MKTSELIGAALDWAVAKCEGFTVEYEEDRNDFWITRTNHAQQFLPPFGYLSEVFHPSEDWSQGGEIIEREGITIFQTGRDWMGYIRHDTESFAPTPLIAAMRCYVTSKLGDEVEVPEGLTA
jgi:hypothetical protein